MRRSVLSGVMLAAVTAGVAVAVVLPPGARSDGPPAGATARCKDGTYSFSATRSGTCSHHGGVADWLDGGGGSAGTTNSIPTTTAATPSTSPSPTTTTSGTGVPPYLSGFVSPLNRSQVDIYTLCFAVAGATATSGDLDFGDGVTVSVGASGTDVQHVYGYAGTYTLTLTCTDSAGNIAVKQIPETVDGPPRPATAPATTTAAAAPAPATPVAPKVKARMAEPTPVALGHTVLVASRTKSSGCILGPNPDRACSPGAYYSGLIKSVLCSTRFHTSSIGNVSESEKHQVETEYRMAPKSYGSTLEIDHIVSLELGGSNEVANLFPEKANSDPGFHVKDKLENEAHRWVCSGKISLHAAQVAIATNWQSFYKRVFGVAP